MMPVLGENPKVSLIMAIQRLVDDFAGSESRTAVAFVSNMDDSDLKSDAREAHVAADAARSMRDKAINLIHRYWPVQPEEPKP